MGEELQAAVHDLAVRHAPGLADLKQNAVRQYSQPS